jgi:hypothetical protein
MSSYEISLDDPPERWRELYAWLESGAFEAPPAAASRPRPAPAGLQLEDPGEIIAVYAAYLAGEL